MQLIIPKKLTIVTLIFGTGGRGLFGGPKVSLAPLDLNRAQREIVKLSPEPRFGLNYKLKG